MIDNQQEPTSGTGEQPHAETQFVHIPSIADAKDMPEGGRPMRLDPRVLNRIQNAVSSLEQDYGSVLVEQVTEIQALTDGVEAQSWSDLERLYDLIHDIRGVAKTFSRPVAGTVADSLCRYIDMLDAETWPDMLVLREHVNALSQMARLTPEPDGALADTILARVEASRLNAAKRAKSVSATAPL